MITLVRDKKESALDKKETKVFTVQKISNNESHFEEDQVVKESPLEIRIEYGKPSDRKKEVLSVTMRTPGDDFNLVTGFLFTEQITRLLSDILSISYVGTQQEILEEKIISVELDPEVLVETSVRRNTITNSACGFCGRSGFDLSGRYNVYLTTSIDEKISIDTLFNLPQLLQVSQGLFAETGGSHAVAILTFDGTVLKICEDVGRHNAMDKLMGHMLNEQSIPLQDRMVLFSGRLSYELVQKSLAGGIPVICSIGAPTSLAIELASDNNATVIGFLKKDRMNVYCGEERIIIEKKNFLDEAAI